MGRGRATPTTSSSSSSIESSNKRDLSTDLRLGLSINSTSEDGNTSFPREQQAADWPPIKQLLRKELGEEETECNSGTFFVKVYMEGIPIGRKLDLFAHDGYNHLIMTLDHMFNTNILWAEADCVHYEQCHVLTYEDKEGDWMMVGDVPWEMFLSTVRRLKITRADRC